MPDRSFSADGSKSAHEERRKPVRLFLFATENILEKFAINARAGRVGPNEPRSRMADTVLEQVLAELRKTAITYFPQKGELKNLRVVGHTPKSDHMIYDVCADLAQGNERMAIKVYRPAKCGGNARAVARQETANLEFAYQSMLKKKLGGIPRPLGDSSELGAVVAEKISGLPLQS